MGDSPKEGAIGYTLWRDGERLKQENKKQRGERKRGVRAGMQGGTTNVKAI